MSAPVFLVLLQIRDNLLLLFLVRLTLNSSVLEISSKQRDVISAPIEVAAGLVRGRLASVGSD